MYNVKTADDQKFKIYILEDTATQSWVKVAPERGGIIFSYGVEGEELLFLNEETFYDKDKNVRGGIPILFPISGQLTEGKYEWKGKTYTMSNHGFARNASWEVIGQDTENGASLTLRLSSNPETKLSYPFDFEVVYTYKLVDGKLTIAQEYKNNGDQPMPMYPGFHPYFKTVEKNIEYETDATKYYDYNDGQIKEFEGQLDLANLKESVVFIDAVMPSITFNSSAISKKIKLDYGNEFKYVVLWTEKGKEFICVEPWMAKNDEFQRGEELVMVQAKETLKTKFKLGLV
ncbi:aldose epimerase [Fredinandcohnia sp. 179-A 10B2 NHS]|uniref:aldose epimerase family protein n=1 Tax=Fredinandcohnia sp. 179-A 10B2 NHS TaxID=3235176 RepID=UPI0039A3CB92